MKNKRYKKIITLVLSIILVFGLVACGGGKYSVTVSSLALSIKQYDTYKLSAEADHDGEITWSTEDEKIATVDKNGLVTANGTGTVKITASTDKAQASCVVTVIASNSFPNLILSQYDAALRVGTDVKVNTDVTFRGDTVSDKPTITWKSGDTKIATVLDGLITGVSYGLTTVDVECEYKGYKLKKSIEVAVRENVTMIVSENTAELYSFNPNDSLDYPTTKSLSVTVYEENNLVTDLSALKWSSSDDSVATVDQNGFISTKEGKEGVVEIMASWKNAKNDEYYDICVVDVKRPTVMTAEAIYQRYAGLDENKEKIINTDELDVDLSSETLLSKLTFSVSDKWVLESDGKKVADTNTTISGKVISLDMPDKLENGSYNLVCRDGLNCIVSVPVEVYNHIFTDKDDIKQFIYYGDDIEEATVGIWPSVFGQETAYTYYGNFALGNDIDFDTDVIANNHPAHSYEGISNVYGLHGVFDGRGHTLSGGIYGKGGIIGFGSYEAVIKNIAVVGATLKSDIMSAVFASSYFGSAENVLTELTTVQAYNANDPFHCRGIFGFYIGGEGSFTNCIFYGNNKDSFSQLAGGGDAVIGHFASPTRTYKECYVFTDYTKGAYFATSGIQEGIYNYSYDTDISGMDMTAFDNSIWDFSGTHASFN